MSIPISTLEQLEGLEDFDIKAVTFGSSSGPSTRKGSFWRCCRAFNSKIITGHARKSRILERVMLWSCSNLLEETSTGNNENMYLLPTMPPRRWLLREGFLSTSSTHLSGLSWHALLLDESEQKHASKNTHIVHLQHCELKNKTNSEKYARSTSILLTWRCDGNCDFLGRCDVVSIKLGKKSLSISPIAERLRHSGWQPRTTFSSRVIPSI